MEGGRFVAGMTGGLLLALVIVGTAGYTSGIIPTSSGSFAQNVSTSQSQSSDTRIMSASTTAAVTSTSGASAATGSAQGSTTYTVISPVMTSTVLSSSASSAKTESQSTQPSYGVPGANGGTASANLSPSRLDSIAKQPVLVDGLVFLPVLAALMLGALLYRASGRTKDNAEKEQASG